MSAEFHISERVMPMVVELTTAHVLIGCPSADPSRHPCAHPLIHDLATRIAASLNPQLIEIASLVSRGLGPAETEEASR